MDDHDGIQIYLMSGTLKAPKRTRSVCHSFFGGGFDFCIVLYLFLLFSIVSFSVSSFRFLCLVHSSPSIADNCHRNDHWPLALRLAHLNPMVIRRSWIVKALLVAV